MAEQQFSAFLVSSLGSGRVSQSIEKIAPTALPAGEVRIQVQWSSLNYKDAMAAAGHPGVAGPLPHVPGIDAAGIVLDSSDSRYSPGDQVLVTGYELGAPAWGGWSEQIRVPAEWIVPLPEGLELRETMVCGTAGFTAAQCVARLQRNDVTPASGPVVVTGATGGVGCLAVQLLAKLGYEVHAVSGKESHHEMLQRLGASKVHGRELLTDHPKKPLLRAQWAGGIDTVGGKILACLLKSTQVGGCVAACGLVAGDQLPVSVYPFILRGVVLAGVTSAMCPRPHREWIWSQLATEWKLALPEEWVTEISLGQLPEYIEKIQRGQVVGRTVVQVQP